MSEERNNEARAHLNAYPLDTNDVQRERMHMLTTFFTNMQDSCYDKCAEDNDFTFLSIREGKCFRNCITKVSYYYPTLKTNLKDASFRYQDELTEKIRVKQGRPTPDLSLMHLLRERNEE
tara:strand:+ start:148 stop:507 length:360 start_codon:yes stop_codon:yes gene_type:complete